MIFVRRELITDDDHFQEIKQTNRALVKGKKQRSFYVDNKITPLFNTNILVWMFTNMIDLLYL